MMSTSKTNTSPQGNRTAYEPRPPLSPKAKAKAIKEAQETLKGSIEEVVTEDLCAHVELARASREHPGVAGDEAGMVADLLEPGECGENPSVSFESVAEAGVFHEREVSVVELRLFVGQIDEHRIGDLRR